MNFTALQTFYIVSAILILAMAIILYPTLKEMSEKRDRKRRK